MKTNVEILTDRFTYHPPDAEKIKIHEYVRKAGLELVMDIAAMCPDGREKSLALTKVEEAIMWANAAIARGSDGA